MACIELAQCQIKTNHANPKDAWTSTVKSNNWNSSKFKAALKPAEPRLGSLLAIISSGRGLYIEDWCASEI